VVGSLVPLGLVCLVVILGNMMVIIAVFNTHKVPDFVKLDFGRESFRTNFEPLNFGQILNP
jgi:hypothetical protein